MLETNNRITSSNHTNLKHVYCLTVKYFIFYVQYSVHRGPIYQEIPTRCHVTVLYFLLCQSLHVSDTFRVHHQEISKIDCICSIWYGNCIVWPAVVLAQPRRRINWGSRWKWCKQIVPALTILMMKCPMLKQKYLRLRQFMEGPTPLSHVCL
jgi:hypothetical protein